LLQKAANSSHEPRAGAIAVQRLEVLLAGRPVFCGAEFSIPAKASIAIKTRGASQGVYLTKSIGVPDPVT
jgi:hypothetical protein